MRVLCMDLLSIGSISVFFFFSFYPFSFFLFTGEHWFTLPFILSLFLNVSNISIPSFLRFCFPLNPSIPSFLFVPPIPTPTFPAHMILLCLLVPLNIISLPYFSRNMTGYMKTAGETGVAWGPGWGRLGRRLAKRRYKVLLERGRGKRGVGRMKTRRRMLGKRVTKRQRQPETET